MAVSGEDDRVHVHPTARLGDQFNADGTPVGLHDEADIAVGGSVLTVLWPRTDWSFSASAADIIAEYIEPEPVEFPLVQRDLALHRSAAYDRNALQLGRLFLVFRLGLVVLVVEVAAWIVALAERA